MPKAEFYFLSEQYYLDFPDDKLMRNKYMLNGSLRTRTCFFVFTDEEIPDIYWIVPISSRWQKYKRLERHIIKKYRRCNTIRFGLVLGRQTAFLIQNMCPAISDYLIPYTDRNGRPIRIDDRVAADVTQNARLVLAMAKRGTKLIFPDVFKIYSRLEQKLLGIPQVLHP